MIEHCVNAGRSEKKKLFGAAVAADNGMNVSCALYGHKKIIALSKVISCHPAS